MSSGRRNSVDQGHLLDQAEALVVGDGQLELLREFFLVGILWNEELVEAGVRTGQKLGIGALPRNGQLGLVSAQALRRCPRAAGDEGQELFLLLQRVFLDDFPEPHDRLRFRVVPIVRRVALEFVKVQCLAPTNQHLQLVRPE